MKSPWVMSEEELIAEVFRLRRTLNFVRRGVFDAVVALDIPGIVDAQEVRRRLEEQPKEQHDEG